MKILKGNLSKFRTAPLFYEYYKRFIRAVGVKKFLVLQVIGILGCFFNILGISSVLPFLSVYMLDKHALLQKYAAPYLGGNIPPWLFNHVQEILGALIIGAFIGKTLLMMAFDGQASKVLEIYTAQLRNRINLNYLYSIGKVMRVEKKSRLMYLNNQLLQFSSFNYALLLINLRIYIFITIFIFLLLLSFKLTMICFGLVVLIQVFGMPLYSWTRRAASLFYGGLESLQGQLVNFWDGAEVIKSLNLVQRQVDWLNVTNKKIISEAYSMSLSRQATFALPELVTVCVVVCGVAFGKPNPAQIVLLGTYFYSALKLVAALNDISIKVNAALEVQQAPQDIYDYLQRMIRMSADVGGKAIAKVDNIEFCDTGVSDNDKIILEHINLRIPMGRKVQIVGDNGSGKSSLVKCLLKFIPFNGVVKVNGLSVNEIDSHSLYNVIAYHGQSQFLFHDTILANILIGNPHFTEAKAKEFCKELGFDRFIGLLENGYDTVVSEGATTLSGGEKQSVCLARTLIGEKDVLILDEYANHLDNDTLVKLNRYLKNLKNKTLIVITHRPVDFCDETIVINQGRLISSSAQA